MAAESVIFDVLSTDGTVIALVGSGANARVNPSFADARETLPYVVFEMIATDRWQAGDGYTGMGQMTYEFRCFATTRLGATALRDAVRIALDHLPTTTVDDQTVEVITALDGDESIDFRDEDSQTPVYMSSIDMEFYVREAVS